jgi:hypothetical protein
VMPPQEEKIDTNIFYHVDPESPDKLKCQDSIDSTDNLKLSNQSTSIGSPLGKI